MSAQDSSHVYCSISVMSRALSSAAVLRSLAACKQKLCFFHLYILGKAPTSTNSKLDILAGGVTNARKAN